MFDREKERNEFLRRYGAECAVLLKTDGAFPLESPCKIALYGSGARKTVKGGTGSGEVNSKYFVTAEAGLEAAGFEITSKAWMDGYDEIYRDAKKRFIRDLKRSALRRGTLAVVSDMGAVMPEPEYELPLDHEGEAAIYVLSRISGEGSDRKPVPGDVLLTETEKRDILYLQRNHKRFMLVLNVGGPVDIGPVMEVGNILLLSQLGSETGNVLADIILGKSAPSGKLSTTWCGWNDRPAIGSFGDRYETRYKEGIYVGYRYYESAGVAPLFPFGFGLSFTRFSIRVDIVREEAGRVSLSVNVKNVGNRNGKEVVQLYVGSPRGRLDKPKKVLAAFEKTGELKPGEEQSLILSFDVRDMASYDAEKAAWILEAGDHVIYIGSSSSETDPAAVLRLDKEATVKTVKNCLGRPDFDDWQPPAYIKEHLEGVPILHVCAPEAESAQYDREEDVDPIAESLDDESLCRICIGAFRQKGSKSVIGDAARSVAGAAGETTGWLFDKGVPAVIMADGPAGLRLSRQFTRDENGADPVGSGLPESVLELLPSPAAFVLKRLHAKKHNTNEVFEQNCSALPIGTALAQSWNVRFAEQCGDIVGDEMERFGVQLWLAPALNIHRDIRCGRNFEYYSEDPLVSGRIAAAVTRGVQKHEGCGVTLKHLAANNQETNRYGSNSLVSERAMREIYLKGFEIAVREGRPRAVMTSYNLLNGVHTSERRDLIEDVLRCEFGFDGAVMTDWIIPSMQSGGRKYPVPNAARIAAAGGDLVMPGSRSDLKKMLCGLKKGAVTRRRLMINASRVVRLARLLNADKGGGIQEDQNETFTDKTRRC